MIAEQYGWAAQFLNETEARQESEIEAKNNPGTFSKA
jgi:hypothetical protein